MISNWGVHRPDLMAVIVRAILFLTMKRPSISEPRMVWVSAMVLLRRGGDVGDDHRLADLGLEDDGVHRVEHAHLHLQREDPERREVRRVAGDGVDREVGDALQGRAILREQAAEEA